MLGASRLPPPAHRLPGLLPWQAFLLLAACGILFLRYPLAAVCAAFCCWLVAWAAGLRLSPILSVLVVLAGMGLGHARLPEADHALPPGIAEGRRVEIEGRVVEVQSRPEGRLVLLLDRAEVHGGEEGGPLPGVVRWTWDDPSMRPLPGQTVAVAGRLLPSVGLSNPGGWDYGFDQRRQSVFWRIYSSGGRGDGRATGGRAGLGARWRMAIVQTVELGLPNTEGGGILLAMLTGERSRLSPDTSDLMRQGGLAHVLALSGVHVGIVAGLGWGLAWIAGAVWPGLLLRIPRGKLAVVLGAPLVLGYVWLGQATPSLVRAAIMFGFWGVLLLAGRGKVLLDGLFLALAAMLLYDPLQLYDMRLQLSAVAVAGIVVFSPVLGRLFRLQGSWPRRLGGRMLGVLAATLCANLALLPLSAWHFGLVSVNQLLNIVWLPVIGVVLLPLAFAGLVVSVFGWAWAGGGMLALAAHGLDGLFGLTRMAAEAGLLPMAAVLRPQWPEMLGYAVILATVACAFGRAGAGRLWAAVALGTALLFAPHLAGLAAQSEGVRLAVIDVGQGQAVLVSAPGGVRCLVDGGGSRSRTWDVGRAVTGPAVAWGRAPALEHVVMTHPHIDHYGGLLHIMEYFSVDRFWTNGRLPSGYGPRFEAACATQGLEPIRLAAGMRIDLGHGVELVALHPDEEFEAPSTNDGSLVLLLRWQGRGLALLASDVEQAGITRLLEAPFTPLGAEVLLLPHHGGMEAASEALLDRVRPEFAVCSTARANRYGLPSPELLQELARRSVFVFDTGRHGAVEFFWSGPEAQVAFHPHP